MLCSVTLPVVLSHSCSVLGFEQAAKPQSLSRGGVTDAAQVIRPTQRYNRNSPPWLHTHTVCLVRRHRPRQAFGGQDATSCWARSCPQNTPQRCHQLFARCLATSPGTFCKPQSGKAALANSCHSLRHMSAQGARATLPLPPAGDPDADFSEEPGAVPESSAAVSNDRN